MTKKVPPPLRQPPWTQNPRGEQRRVGVELEMAGLSLDRLAAVVAEFLGATIETSGRYERTVIGDAAGEWGVELDFDLLKRLGREQRESGTWSDDLANSAEDSLNWLAAPLVPLELVSPPLPLERLPDVERLIAILREAGATGTSDSLVNAFGMQFNPEIPSEAPAVLAAYLQAFLCLYDWLVARAEINFTRRLTTYIDPFPRAYVRKVVDPDYAPDKAALIDDYLRDNPTRNRALDMLPLFLHLDETRVRRVTTDPLIKARPTFHYRLPNCEIDRPDWGLYLAWNDWIEVERLAADAERLEACCTAYSKFLDSALKRWLGDWQAQIEQRWLAP
ncbi:MAG: amidoligase family protein [Gammaproteobacteria bacterium]